jgi:hypothetical protein
VKWRNWKLHFFRQDTMFDPPARLPVPTIYNLFTDPREEKPTVESWVVHPMLRIVGEFEASLRRHPLIPMGTPDQRCDRRLSFFGAVSEEMEFARGMLTDHQGIGIALDTKLPKP